MIPGGGGCQRRSDQPAGIRGIDDVVDLEYLSGVERLGILLRRGGCLAYAFFTFVVIGDRLELFAKA